MLENFAMIIIALVIAACLVMFNFLFSAIENNYSTPRSNMTHDALTSLITGRYHIVASGHENSETQNHWSVRYYAPDGKTHFCEYGQGFNREWTLDRHVIDAPFGLAGIAHGNLETINFPGGTVLPVVADAEQGMLYLYSLEGESRYEIDHEWTPRAGWIQKEYAAVFEKYCRGLPRVDEVNENQVEPTLKELHANAIQVHDFETVFESDPENPKEAGLYYSGHIPNFLLDSDEQRIRDDIRRMNDWIN